jgi:ubiquinone/menaquinone biosynthesis C-methylase UbiE
LVKSSSAHRVFERLYAQADALNRRNILDLIGPGPHTSLCDLGCDDGSWTTELASACGNPKAYGVEIVASRAEIARARGIEVAVSDLGERFPFSDGEMGVVHANQVIEHVTDVDHFLSEVQRILRVGGLAIISTENGSSWHNILAACMGWQIFSATNISRIAGGIGNPLALHRGAAGAVASWTHKTILNYRGFRELAEVHRLKVVDIVGAGYHPLPARVGRLDPRHSHFLALKAVKIA